jgi:hypothetical protein
MSLSADHINVRFRAAIAVPLEPVRTAQAVLVRSAFEQLGESPGLTAGKIDWNRDSLSVSHGGIDTDARHSPMSMPAHMYLVATGVS